MQIIGEAGSKVSDETRQQHSNIDWRDIIGIRQRIVHDYDNVKFEIVWNTVVNDLPILIQQLDAILPPFTQNQ
ncbi:MAG: HepT-like ribonuclease domain-containing protein, partial [Chloroflexota bacterium]